MYDVRIVACYLRDQLSAADSLSRSNPCHYRLLLYVPSTPRYRLICRKPEMQLCKFYFQLDLYPRSQELLFSQVMEDEARPTYGNGWSCPSKQLTLDL